MKFLAVIWLYSLASVCVVSMVSLIGVLAFSIRKEHLTKLLQYLVSFSAGGLFGSAFIHLVPEAAETNGFNIQISMYILYGVIASFVVDKLLQWRHCHIPTTEEHPHSFAYMNLFGDGVHNFIDGLIIGGSYMASIPLGISTTITVIFHEIPQEIGDFGVLIYGGFSRSRAVFFNFSTALSAILGVFVVLILRAHLLTYIVPFAAGNFIYIAGSDLIPELHKEESGLAKSILQLTAFVLGVLILYLLSLVE